MAASGTNVGVNGVAVVKTGDTYLCYMAVSYHNFSIRCYDVTDPENIVLYTDFAQNGVCQTAYTPFYLATDTQGNVYATGSANSVYYVTKIGPDGTQLKQIELAKAYSIVLCGGYLVVGDSQEGKITILDTNLSEVKKLTVDGLSGNLAQSAVGGGYIFLSDSGNGEEAGGLAGGFYRAPVSLVDYTKPRGAEGRNSPTVDGRLDEALWANRFFTHTDEASGKPMRFQFAWDTDNLYLAVRLADTTPFSARTKRSRTMERETSIRSNTTAWNSIFPRPIGWAPMETEMCSLSLPARTTESPPCGWEPEVLSGRTTRPGNLTR